MSMLMTSILAAALLAQSPDAIVLSGVVVDADEKPVSGVDVVLPARRSSDGSLPTLVQTTTNEKGEFRLEFARKRFPEAMRLPFLWAYRHGGSIAVQRTVIKEKGEMPPIQLILEKASPRIVKLVGSDERPLAGVRVAPVLYVYNGVTFFQTPDDRLDSLAMTTGGDGFVTMPYFPPLLDPLTIRVTAPSIAPHELSLPDRHGGNQSTLKVGPPASLTGSVYYDSGEPAKNVAIEVWAVETSYDLPLDRGKAMLRPYLIRFSSGPVRTQADGSFRTPPQLLTGSTYKIMIRVEGSPLVSSQPLVATTALATVPPIRLQQSRKLRGLVKDRQGQPVAGAVACFFPPASRQRKPMPAADSCSRECFLRRHTCSSRPRVSGSTAGRASRPDSPVSLNSSSREPPSRPTTPWRPRQPRSPPRNRTLWRLVCSSLHCKPRWPKATLDLNSLASKP